jgi:hypothetical protein
MLSANGVGVVVVMPVRGVILLCALSNCFSASFTPGPSNWPLDRFLIGSLL